MNHAITQNRRIESSKVSQTHKGKCVPNRVDSNILELKSSKLVSLQITYYVAVILYTKDTQQECHLWVIGCAI